MSHLSLTYRLHRSLVTVLSARRRNILLRGASRVANSYLDLVGNLSYDPYRNGEFWVLENLSDDGIECVFDVGANEGDWVAGASALLRDARFHCFEIVPETAKELAERTETLGDRIYVNAVGLSDQEGTCDVHVYPDFSEGASAVDYTHTGMPSTTQVCRVVTGDGYCSEHEITHIDLLKIDTEGLDLQVLRGFDNMLASGAIDVVQFEYGRANVASRSLLADFYVYLGEHGFVVGKIWPKEVDFRDYDLRTDEDFRGPNYLAIRRERSDLIRRFGSH